MSDLLLDDNSMQFVSGLIKRYYDGVINIAPKNIASREFGFGTFERKIAYRHYAFRTEKVLKDYLVSKAPPFVSISSAEYEKPDVRPMESKIWKGSGLVFDIDAGDLRLECQKTHSSKWVCGNCLDGAKKETEKLINDFLIPDFGFAEREISVNFSGNRGYHIHVQNDSVFALDSNARASISNYIKGNGIEISAFFPTINRKGVRLEGPKPTDSGWGGKLANGVIRAINSGKGELEAMGIEKRYANILVKKRAGVILGITTGNWDMIEIPKKGEFWSNVLKGISVRQGDAIDKNVTTDIYHLIRLPGTIHGDTGLIAKAVKSVDALVDFDPMNEAVAFDDNRIKIKVSDVGRFTMNGNEFGPYKDETVSLPCYAGMYLVLKGFGTISN